MRARRSLLFLLSALTAGTALPAAASAQRPGGGEIMRRVEVHASSADAIALLEAAGAVPAGRRRDTLSFSLPETDARALSQLGTIRQRQDLDEIRLVRETIDVKSQRARDLEANSTGRRLRLLHFSHPLTVPEKQELAAEGIRLLGSYGPQSWMAWVDEHARDASREGAATLRTRRAAAATAPAATAALQFNGDYDPLYAIPTSLNDVLTTDALVAVNIKLYNDGSQCWQDLAEIMNLPDAIMEEPPDDISMRTVVNGAFTVPGNRLPFIASLPTVVQINPSRQGFITGEMAALISANRTQLDGTREVVNDDVSYIDWLTGKLSSITGYNSPSSYQPVVIIDTGVDAGGETVDQTVPTPVVPDFREGGAPTGASRIVFSLLLHHFDIWLDGESFPPYPHLIKPHSVAPPWVEFEDDGASEDVAKIEDAFLNELYPQVDKSNHGNIVASVLAGAPDWLNDRPDPRYAYDDVVDSPPDVNLLFGQGINPWGRIASMKHAFTNLELQPTDPDLASLDPVTNNPYATGFQQFDFRWMMMVAHYYLYDGLTGSAWNAAPATYPTLVSNNSWSLNFDLNRACYNGDNLMHGRKVPPFWNCVTGPTTIEDAPGAFGAPEFGELNCMKQWLNVDDIMVGVDYMTFDLLNEYFYENPGPNSSYEAPGGLSDDVYPDPRYAGREPALFIFAAGNSGFNDSTLPGEPTITRPAMNTISPIAAAKNVLTVGGCESEDRRRESPPVAPPSDPFLVGIGDDANDIAVFTSKGNDCFGRYRVKPDIVAPAHGVYGNMYSTAPYATDSDVPAFGSHLPIGQVQPKAYVRVSGTSYATPQVSGAVQLFDFLLRNHYGVARPMPSLLKAYTIHTAKFLTGQHTGPYDYLNAPNSDPKDDWITQPLPNAYQGFGRLNLDAGLDTTVSRLIRNEEDTLEHGDPAYAKEGSLLNSKPMRAVLTWTDPIDAVPPGSDKLYNDLNNNLDLRVTYFFQTEGDRECNYYKVVFHGNRFRPVDDPVDPSAAVRGFSRAMEVYGGCTDQGTGCVAIYTDSEAMAPDAVNNVEAIFLPPAGEVVNYVTNLLQEKQVQVGIEGQLSDCVSIKVEVIPVNIQHDPVFWRSPAEPQQPFSLVVSNFDEHSPCDWRGCR